LVLPFCNIVVQAQQTDVFAREIRFSSSRGTVYEMLNQITEQSGFWFVYDSDLIDNEKKVTVSKGVYPLREAILQITGNNTLEMKLIGRHILLYKEISYLQYYQFRYIHQYQQSVSNMHPGPGDGGAFGL
jgi:hypothetical protein